MKLKVYIMHSEKIDYKNEIYKPLLEKGLMEYYDLVLPLTDKYISKYIKDLLNECDIVLCDLTKFNIFSKFELKIAKKLNKNIYYFINEKAKKKRKYKDLEINIYKDSNEYALLVKTVLDSLNHKELFLKRDNIFCLGKIEKIK